MCGTIILLWTRLPWRLGRASRSTRAAPASYPHRPAWRCPLGAAAMLTAPPDLPSSVACRTQGEACEGTVFTCESGLLVLEQYNSSSVVETKATYRVINATCVKDLRVLAEPAARPADAPELPPLPAPNADLAKTREERAVAKAEAEGQKVCQDATAHAQKVFNELAKTMSIEWMTKEGVEPMMLLMDTILISSPYTPETVKAKKGEDSRLLERVQKVLAGILKKMVPAADVQ